MAASEYYNPGGGLNVPQQGPRPQQYAPPNQSQQNISSLPYPISDAPPPYTPVAGNQRPVSQPPPQNRVHFQQNGYQQTPAGGPYQQPPPQNGGYQYPPEKTSQRPPQNMYSPSGAPGPYQPQQPQGQAGYPFPNGQPPAMQQPYGNSLYPDYPDSNNGSRDRSRSRSRDGRKHHRHHHHNHHGSRPDMGKKKGSGLSTFLGAGGGAVIGDALFPGLGTLGGAVLGGLGGHEYGRQRRSYSNPGKVKDRAYDDRGLDDIYGRGRRH